jgi:hypothetical protein
MNERYRYGYGEDALGRERPLAGGSSVTDQREDDSVRGDEEDEEARADRIREAAADSRTDTDGVGSAPATADAAGTTEVAEDEDGDAPSTSVRTTSDSVFDVEDDAAATEGTGGTPAKAAETPEEEDHAPIALGPPSREKEDEEATAAATTAEDPAATTADDSAASTDDEPGAATDGEPEARDVQKTSVFEPARPTSADPVANGAEPPLDESGTEAPVVATEEPPVVLPDEGAAPVAVVSAAVVTEAVSDRRPEGAPGTVEERASLLGAIDPDETRARFLDIQAGFVDEPRQAVHEAERFVDDLVQQLVRALETERASLKSTIENGSTEDLRVALRGYRAFVDRLLNLR